ncbi:MAG: 3-isopropylmalate dehydrogenase [Chloroflexi bacterium]|nr:3-isopropylmalate dehydrogenase [Chloroflexota bacterium]
MEFKVAVVPGDGVGPDVVAEGVRALQAAGRKFGHKFTLQETVIGGQAVKKYGSSLPKETLDICAWSDAILFGSVGEAKEDFYATIRPGGGLAGLRKHFELFCNLRPIWVYPALINVTPLKPEVIRDTNYLVIRYITGGIVYGKPRGLSKTKKGRRAVNTIRFAEEEAEKALRTAFEIARSRRKKLTLVNHSNVLEIGKLWRQVAVELAPEYADVELEHQYSDNCAHGLIHHPRHYDVVIFEDMAQAGMVNDEGANIMGSMGMPPSGELCPNVGKSVADGLLHCFGLYQSIHGTAPDIAGQGIANPIATILSVAMMLRYSFNLPREAAAIDAAVGRVLDKGYRTVDIMEPGKTRVSTREIGELIAAEVEKGT